MEKVWEELKKIDAQAESIHAEAQKAVAKLADVASQKAEKLIANSKMYAEEDAEQLYSREVEASNGEREKLLRENQENVRKLKARAERRVDQAASAVEAAVLGETKR